MGMRIREDGEADEKGRVRDEGSSEVNTRKREVQVHALGYSLFVYLIKVHEAFPQGLYYVRLKLRVGDEGCVEPIP